MPLRSTREAFFWLWATGIRRQPKWCWLLENPKVAQTIVTPGTDQWLSAQ
jgi:hypothetical protein